MRTIKLFEKHHALGYLNNGMLQAALGNCYVNIGKAFLDMNDRLGIKYYKDGLYYSRGFHNKMRCIIGLVLFAVPKSLRNFIIHKLYQLNAFVFNK